MRKGFLLLGALFLLAALALTGYNLWDAHRADKAAQETVEELHDAIEAEPAAPELTQEMPVVEIDGNDYIGVLSFPSLSLELPVMAEWDYARLKIAPCRYDGSYFTGDLVIAAHNYAKHFSPIKWIAPGAEVILTAADGAVRRYTVLSTETLSPTQIEEMITPDGWDLTLFTCNLGGQTRCAVRCAQIG